jgi:hypothetical protein
VPFTKLRGAGGWGNPTEGELGGELVGRVTDLPVISREMDVPNELREYFVVLPI